MPHCVFSTESAATEYCATAYASWIAVHNSPPRYVATTTAWATPAQRLTDGKWFAPVCPATDNTGQTIETSEPSWYPEPELP